MYIDVNDLGNRIIEAKILREKLDNKTRQMSYALLEGNSALQEVLNTECANIRNKIQEIDADILEHVQSNLNK